MDNGYETIFSILSASPEWTNTHPLTYEGENYFLRMLKKYVPWFGDILKKEDLLETYDMTSSHNYIPSYVIVLNNLFREKRITREDYRSILSYDKNLSEWFFKMHSYGFQISGYCGVVKVRSLSIGKNVCRMFYDKLLQNTEDYNLFVIIEAMRRNDENTFNKYPYDTRKNLSILRYAVKFQNEYFIQKILEDFSQFAPAHLYVEKVKECKILISFICKAKSFTLEGYFKIFQPYIKENFVQALYELGILIFFITHRVQIDMFRNGSRKKMCKELYNSYLINT